MRNPTLAALDFDNLSYAAQCTRWLMPYVGGFKIGNVLSSASALRSSMETIRRFSGRKAIFLDIKLGDIPETVEKVVTSLAQYNPTMLSVTAATGIDSIRAAVAAAEKHRDKKRRKRKMGIFVLTVPTSFSEERCQHVFRGTIKETILRFAWDAKEAGAQGVICSGLYASLIKGNPDLAGLEVISPAIRSAGVPVDDQRQSATPEQALGNGADWIVIGREITQSRWPRATARKIRDRIMQLPDRKEGECRKTTNCYG